MLGFSSQYLGPISLTVAVSVLAILHAVLPNQSNYFNVMWSIITVGVVMDMSYAEKLLVKALLRSIGTVIGAGLGMVIVTNTENLMKLVLLPVFGMGLSLCMKASSEPYIFHLASITMVIVGFSDSVLSGLYRFTSVFIGIAVSVISAFVFAPNAKQSLIENYEKVGDMCIRLLLADQKDGDSRLGGLCEIRRAVFFAEEAYTARKKLRKWTHCFAEESKMEKLSQSAINFYHESHNFYLMREGIKKPVEISTEEMSLRDLSLRDPQGAKEMKDLLISQISGLIEADPETVNFYMAFACAFASYAEFAADLSLFRNIDLDMARIFSEIASDLNRFIHNS
jgi:Fusaric acid resistance protein family